MKGLKWPKSTTRPIKFLASFLEAQERWAEFQEKSKSLSRGQSHGSLALLRMPSGFAAQALRSVVTSLKGLGLVLHLTPVSRPGLRLFCPSGSGLQVPGKVCQEQRNEGLTQVSRTGHLEITSRPLIQPADSRTLRLIATKAGVKDENAGKPDTQALPRRSRSAVRVRSGGRRPPAGRSISA